MQCAGLFCVDIYELRLEFGVHYLLAAVQADNAELANDLIAAKKAAKKAAAEAAAREAAEAAAAESAEAAAPAEGEAPAEA